MRMGKESVLMKQMAKEEIGIWKGSPVSWTGMNQC